MDSKNIEKIISMCDFIVNAIIENNYDELQKLNIFTRTPQEDFIRALNEYMEDANAKTITKIPKFVYHDTNYRNGFGIISYKDGSGWHIDLDLWMDGERSDLTLQLNALVDKSTGELCYFQIDDIHIL